MTRWLALATTLVLGCSSPQPRPRPSAGTAAPRVATGVDAGVAAPPIIDAAQPRVGDPPEPAAPVADCAFTRTVFCTKGIPTRTARQPSPFQWCEPTQPARGSSVVKQEARFSALETRARRVTQPDACCYVEFSTMACD